MIQYNQNVTYIYDYSNNRVVNDFQLNVQMQNLSTNIFSFFMDFKFKICLCNARYGTTKAITTLSQEYLQAFHGATNDFDNYDFILITLRDQNVNLEHCKYLDCYIFNCIAIFTQYDTDGVEFQVLKENENMRKYIEIFFEKYGYIEGI